MKKFTDTPSTNIAKIVRPNSLSCANCVLGKLLIQNTIDCKVFMLSSL